MYTIFFSWQSDVKENSNDIRKALKDYANQNELVNIDEATRNCSGSPNIPTTIFNKIGKCDIFICDLTTTIKKGDDCIPNPNVLVELGYAVKTLGWERIVCFLKKDESITDYPFDINQQRLSPYTNRNELKKIAKTAIDTIINNYNSICDRFYKDSIQYKNESVFQKLNGMLSETELYDIIQYVPTNLFIRHEEYKKMDSIIEAFKYASNKFLTNELNYLFQQYIDALQTFDCKCITYLRQIVSVNVKYEDRCWKYPEYDYTKDYHERLAYAQSELTKLSETVRGKYELFILKKRQYTVEANV